MPKWLRENPESAFFFALGIIIAAGVALLAGVMIGVIILTGLSGWAVWKYLMDRRPKTTVQELHQSALAQFRDVPTAEAFTNDFTRDFLNRHENNWPVMNVSGAMVETARALFRAEHFGQVPLPPTSGEPIEEAKYREELYAKLNQGAQVEQFTETVHESFSALSRKLPPIARCVDQAKMMNASDSAITVPLRDVIHDPSLINELILPLFTNENIAAGLFKTTRTTLQRNLYNLSGESFGDDARHSRLILPEKFKGSLSEAVPAYLAGTPFAPIFEQRIPFELPQQTRFEHHWIIAGTGHGKTQTLQTMIMEDLQRVAAGGASVVVIDSQGDLIKNIGSLKIFAAGQPLHDRLCLIDPTDLEYPVALNLFDVGVRRMSAYSPLDRERLLNSAIEVLEYILTSLLGSEMTTRQSTLFRFSIQAMLVIPNATIHTFRELMQPHGHDKYRTYLQQLDPTARDFFETQFTGKLFDQTKQQVVARLFALCENRTFDRIFANPTTKLDLFAEMNSGKVILVNTAKDLLKQSGTEVFGRFFIALIAQIAQERAVLPADQRMPTFVYIDEAQDYIASDSNIATILEQARKQKIGLILAHQFLGQLSGATLDSLYANTSIKYAGGVGDRDAHALARNMRAKPELLERQPKGSYAAFVRNYTDEAVSIQFPVNVMERQPRMSETDASRLRDHMRAKYATPRVQPRPAATSPDTSPSVAPMSSPSTPLDPPADDWRS